MRIENNIILNVLKIKHSISWYVSKNIKRLVSGVIGDLNYESINLRKWWERKSWM